MSGLYPPKFLSEIPGQSRAKEMLFRAIENGRLASTMLFRGGECLGKFAAALALVKWLKCQNPAECDGTCHSCRLLANFDHPDIEVVIPLTTEIEEKTNKISELMASISKDLFAPVRLDKNMRIGIDAVRELNQRVALAPSSEGGRWTIVRDADTMTLDAANAFLKTLEEPPRDSFIILTSSRPDYLLPTILSRAQAIQFRRLSRSQIAGFAAAKGKANPEELALKSDGNLSFLFCLENDNSYLQIAEALWSAMLANSEGAALTMLADTAKSAPATKAILESTLSLFRDQLLFQTGNPSLIINHNSKGKIAELAASYPYSDRLSRVIRLLDEKIKDLRFFPQYDLFAIATAIEGMKILRGESFYVSK